MKYKIILLALFGILMVLTYMATTKQYKEGFEGENKSQDQSQEITEVITLLNDTLCPVYKILLDDLTSDPMSATTPQEANQQIEKAAGGKLFPCPPPADPIQLSATIDLDLQRTINYYDTKLQEMVDTTTKALTTCATATEGFQTMGVCPPPFGKTTSPPPPPKPQSCVDPSTLTEEDKKQILKQRTISLAKVLSQEENSMKLAKIKKNTQELMELKQKAERGELQPSC